jgi:hypothetical protein
MNRRKNHKILRAFENGNQLETTFELNKNVLLNDFFREESENIMIHYKDTIRYCIIEDDFPYFYALDEKRAPIFHATCYSKVGFIANDNYRNFNDLLKLFKHFNENNKNNSSIMKEQSERILLDAYEHFESQQMATLGYAYNLEAACHVIQYHILISESVYIDLELHFNSETIVVQCSHRVKGKSKKSIKIVSGNFETACKEVFKENDLLNCLHDETIEFNSDFREVFKLNEIVDY